MIAIVGTTIAPWQLFFQQSCVADKRLRFSDLTSARLDTLIGAVFTILVAGCMMLAGNAAFVRHWDFRTPPRWPYNWVCPQNLRAGGTSEDPVFGIHPRIDTGMWPHDGTVATGAPQSGDLEPGKIVCRIR